MSFFSLFATCGFAICDLRLATVEGRERTEEKRGQKDCLRPSVKPYYFSTQGMCVDRSSTSGRQILYRKAEVQEGTRPKAETWENKTI